MEKNTRTPARNGEHYFHIKADGTEEKIEGDINDLPLDQIQKLVGGYITIIKIPAPAAPMGYQHMICNEDGLRLKLPVNEFATALYQTGEQLVGDVILVANHYVH